MPQRRSPESLDLDLLRVFDAVHRLGSVSRAGASLGLSQPATSYLLARLRRQLDDPLFESHRGRMLPTPRAEAITSAVREVLELVRTRIVAMPRFDPRTTERTFRLMLTDVGGHIVLPRLLPVLRTLAPRARFEVIELAAGELERALGAGELDLAIGSFPDLPGGIVQQRLYDRDFVVVCGPAHPPLPLRLTLERYLELDHVAVRSAVRSRGAVEVALDRLGKRRRVVVTVPHWLVVPRIVATTPVVATVPRELEAAFREACELRCFALPFRVGATTLRQYWHRRFQRDPAGRWLRDVVRRELIE